MYRFKQSCIIFLHFITFLVSAAIFFLPFGLRFSFLLHPSRTLGIMAVTFTVLYVLLTKVYGGMEVGYKKSKPIIYSFAVNLLITDMATHLFLCIMNVTVVNEGRFVYEAPWLLLLIYVLQVVAVSALAYLGNGIYFSFHKPADCLVIKHSQDDVDMLIRKISKWKKQYRVADICDCNEENLLDRIDKADTVFVYNLAMAERAPIVSYCYQKRKEIFYNMEISDVVSMGSRQMIFDDTPMVHYSVKGLTFEQRIIKRAMDLAASLLGLIIASPIMLITALAIKLEDGGPVFYQQPRVTYAGRVFSVLKFRSMRVQDGSIHRSVSKDDDRITKVGHVIRKFRIDELPQLINILKSDMSLVGPRPEMVENVEKYTKELPEFAYRLRAKAGLTGMAQVFGKYNTSPADKLALDLSYIENYSVLLDIKLIMQTVMVLLTPEESTEAFEQKPASNAASENAEEPQQEQHV